MTLALIAAAALAAAPDPALYAIIVGYNGGHSGGDGPTLPPLRFADDDALRFHRWFKGLTPADHLWLLAEPDETTRATLGEDAPVLQPKSISQKMRRLERGRPATFCGRAS